MGLCLLPLDAGSRVNAGEFHLHPHYREKTPLETVFALVDPGLDGFESEKRAAEIAPILDAWSASLRLSPQNTASIVQVLAKDCTIAGWTVAKTRPLRAPSAGLEVSRVEFSAEQLQSRELIVARLRSYLKAFSKIHTAEFQITGIESDSAVIRTQVRYELVGSGSGFYREQRSGIWQITWLRGDTLQVSDWKAGEEIRSHSTSPLFTDITQAALGSNKSYSAQMLHGADYWRTVLDGATGIDIYGHNGVSVGDLFGSGFDDIYVCQPAGLPNRLYRNRGDGTFEDVSESSGLGLLANTACALIADFDNDGRQDIVVVCANGPLLFRNEGNGKFGQKPDAFQFASPPQGTFTGAAAADYDHDGNLDIYFCLYTFYQGADQYRYPAPYFAAENGPPNFLMRNDGKGTFRDVTRQSGLDANNTRYSFCCGWGDFNNDGWADLYVVNDFGRKTLYRNNGDGTFTDIAAEVGVEDVGAGMSVCWLDANNDGMQDLYVANMWTAAGERVTSDSKFQQSSAPDVRGLYRKHAMGNSLLIGSGAKFRDETQHSGTGMGRWAWSSDAWDFDHDGFSDIYIANGMLSGANRQDLNSFFWRQVVAKSPNSAKADADYEQGWNAVNELIRSDYSWSGFERNVFYANNRDGTFSDVSGAVGLDCLEDSRAFALADLDGDGRQEMVIKNRNAPQIRLMKNMAGDLPPAISFRLRGSKSNRDGIGAAVTLHTSAGKQVKLLQAGSGFLSQHSKDVFFGLGDATSEITAVIQWPSGIRQELIGLVASHRIFVHEEHGITRTEPFGRGLITGTTPELTGEILPEQTQTWLLVPVLAPKFAAGKRTLLNFHKVAEGLSQRVPDLEVVNIDTSNPAHEELSAIYNLLFRSLFDRHRDMPLPTSFLIDEGGYVVKVYQGTANPQELAVDLSRIPKTDADRQERALPFPGLATGFSFGRNYLSLGSVFYQHGYSEASGTYFEAALRDDNRSAEALYGLGSVALKQGRDSDAEHYFDRATKSKASYPETGPNAWNNLGLLATRQNDTPRAISYFEKALELNADYFVALENLGSAYRQEKRWEDAKKALEHALVLKPNDPEANYNLGMVFAQLDDASQAYNHLRKALDLRPAYPEALNNLGILYLRTRRRDQAVETFQKCIALAPSYEQAYLNLARVYSIEGNISQARSVLQALLVQHPASAAAQKALAELR